MGIEYASVVGHPLDEVFAWHTRPGAMRRLVPPWQPMTVVKETESLADGRAILGLPGGLRWVAQHDPAGYDPPNQFVDVLSSDGLMTLPPRVIGWWRHTHRYSDAGGGATRVHDIVDTTVPAAALRSTFAYRHRQLAEDLAAHRDAAEAGAGPMVVAMTGSSGLVGTALAALLTTGGHRVIRLVRRDPAGADERRWEPDQPDPALLEGVDSVVHLAGESIAGRFTEAHRKAIRDSRIEPTRRLAEVAAATSGVRTFVSASAVGFYGHDCGDTVLDEDSPRGRGFLADVVAEWEAATGPAADAGRRVVMVRTGIVQAAAGGTLRLLRPLFALGLGGRLGSGRQWLSWIGIDDLLDIYYRALYDSRLAGPVNAVAPNPVRNFDYTRALAQTLHRPALLPVPAVGPRVLLGRQGAVELAEADQRVAPARLQALRHRFRQPDVADALAHQLGHDPAPGVL
ncbi:TIGR01777 family oxidoreductase [Mycolicibacterium sp.]|uniref:TIGR01777 family oxidoreductase n=1 Tax=Mycolicibacterium sp. TaxID=2320850 RepID=UPI001D54BE2D|nr:TIGR01777 family oxidoreductase [Mycolicibacterium sp.]MCB1291299.1 TIGR01777 family oxidoreductase [Mycobacterium sp.]MCB9411139.1 TIGR01777 family protein [Mycolicibacterium sp.]